MEKAASTVEVVSQMPGSEAMGAPLRFFAAKPSEMMKIIWRKGR